VVTFENSPSKVAAADQPLVHFISTEAVVSAESDACAAPLTTKQRLERSTYDPVGVEIVRPGRASAQGEEALTRPASQRQT